MDRAGADFFYSVQTIVDRLSARPVPIQIPVGAEDQFKGVVDLVTMKARIWHDETLGAKYDDVEIPAELLDKAREYREQLVEAVSESDDVLFEKFVEGKPITEKELAAGIRKATLLQKIFPVICGSSFKNKGVQNLLDAVCDYLPSPLDVPPIEAISVDDPNTKLERHADDSQPFSALIFKIMTDPFVGQLCFLRVYSGKLNTGDTILNASRDKRERIGRLVKMHANKREEITEVMAGDICAAVGLKQVATGDTICDEKSPVLLESIDFPTPVIQLAIEPKTKADQEKMGLAIAQARHRRSDPQGEYRPRNRTDHSGRYGRVAPRDHRRPHEARVQRGSECGQTAGRLPRNHSPDGGIRLHAQEADRWQRSIRARQAAR